MSNLHSALSLVLSWIFYSRPICYRWRYDYLYILHLKSKTRQDSDKTFQLIFFKMTWFYHSVAFFNIVSLQNPPPVNLSCSSEDSICLQIRILSFNLDIHKTIRSQLVIQSKKPTFFK